MFKQMATVEISILFLRSEQQQQELILDIREIMLLQAACLPGQHPPPLLLLLLHVSAEKTNVIPVIQATPLALIRVKGLRLYVSGGRPRSGPSHLNHLPARRVLHLTIDSPSARVG